MSNEMSSEGNGLEERGAGRFSPAVCWGVFFSAWLSLKENNKIKIKLLGSYWNGTQFRGNFSFTSKQKGWLNLWIYRPVSWYQILIPLSPQCHSMEKTGLFGSRSFCIHAFDWSYMKGNPSDWEYEKPTCYTDKSSYGIYIYIFVPRWSLSANCTIGAHKGERQFPRSRRFNHVLEKDVQWHYFSCSQVHIHRCSNTILWEVFT